MGMNLILISSLNTIATLHASASSLFPVSAVGLLSSYVCTGLLVIAIKSYLKPRSLYLSSRNLVRGL